jgi:F0F1-type ATP synthase assembly protein I
MQRVYARRLLLITLALIVVLAVVFAVVQGGGA